MKLLIVVVAVLGAAYLMQRALGAGETNNREPDVQAILKERVVSWKAGGIVVGIVDERGVRMISEGVVDGPGSAAVNGHTVFEIGSATKVFTATLLADMVGRGEMRLEDPMAKFLPDSVKVPSRNGREITLVDLVTHTSGLPRLPDNLKPADGNNPYADYTVEQMYAFLSGHKLRRDVGSKYEYSNFGMGLLGHAIALKARTNYESLVIERICRPLGMESTRITLSPELKARLARGHGETGEPVGNWDLPTLAGAGALRSTANDLLKFISANLGFTSNSLSPALQKTHEIHFRSAGPGLDIALAWHVYHKFGKDIIWHNGGTGGYHSFIGFDPAARRGVVVLANSANSIDDIALHLLDGRFPLQKYEPPSVRTVVKVDPKIYDAYAGRYELAPNVYFTIRRDGGRLMAQLTGQSSFEVFPESETNFFYKVVDAQLTFVKDEKGAVTGLVLHQNGQNPEARKVE